MLESFKTYTEGQALSEDIIPFYRKPGAPVNDNEDVQKALAEGLGKSWQAHYQATKAWQENAKAGYNQPYNKETDGPGVAALEAKHRIEKHVGLLYPVSQKTDMLQHTKHMIDYDNGNKEALFQAKTLRSKHQIDHSLFE